MFLTYFFTIIVGAISWTFAEYVLHRFLGHELKGLNRKFVFYREHNRHHYRKNYFARTQDKILTCVGIGPVVFGLSYFLFSLNIAVVYTISFLGMYFVYELIHRRMHTHRAPHAYARRMRAHHFYHHHKDPRVNHGVTTAFWDRVFGTFVKANIDEVYSLEKIGEVYENRVVEC